MDFLTGLFCGVVLMAIIWYKFSKKLTAIHDIIAPKKEEK